MAQVKVHQHKCPECSANLTVPDEATSVRCNYCGNTLSVEHKRPPKNPTQAVPHTIYVPSGPPLAARFAMFAGPLVPIIVLTTIFWPRLRSAIPVLGNQLPTECALNGDITIKDKTFTGKGPLIKAGMNCTIHIENSTLSADTIVEADVNMKLEIVHSTLTATRRAIVGGTNANIHVSGKSEIRGEKGALDVSSNAIMRLDDSKVSSAGTAIKADSNLSLEATGGEISGSPAVESSGTAQRYEIDGTQITGAQKIKKR